MNETYLTIVIPAYNEESRIGESLKQIRHFLEMRPYASEIIVSDDGSSDKTVTIAKEALQGFPSKVLDTSKNCGKGAAVRRGMLQGSGKFIIFSDADLSTPIEEASGFLKALESGYDVVIGSRSISGANVETHQPFWREWMGRFFNCFARMLAFRQIQDSQCGFKGFRHEAAQDLFSRQKIDRFSFDAEIVFLSQRLGYKLLEKPVIWRDSPNSRVKLLSDPLNMFLDLLRIRWIHRSL